MKTVDRLSFVPSVAVWRKLDQSVRDGSAHPLDQSRILTQIIGLRDSLDPCLDRATFTQWLLKFAMSPQFPDYGRLATPGLPQWDRHQWRYFLTALDIGGDFSYFVNEIIRWALQRTDRFEVGVHYYPNGGRVLGIADFEKAVFASLGPIHSYVVEAVDYDRIFEARGT